MSGANNKCTIQGHHVFLVEMFDIIRKESLTFYYEKRRLQKIISSNIIMNQSIEAVKQFGLKIKTNVYSFFLVIRYRRSISLTATAWVKFISHY